MKIRLFAGGVTETRVGVQLVFFFFLLRVAATAFGGDSPSQAPEVRNYAPYRLYGTNLYDFSEIIQSVLNGIPDRRYCLRGVIVSVDIPGVPNSLVLRRAAGPGGYQFLASTNQAVRQEDLIAALGAVSFSKSTNGMISIAQYTLLSPGAQTCFQWVQPTEDVLVANLPRDFLKPGKSVQLFALPLGRYKPKDPSLTGPEGILYFDYGQRFPGEPSSFPVVLRITKSGEITSKLQPENAARNSPTKSAATEKLIRWQHLEATNGAAHAQYSLGKRYLNGDGVERDAALGKYWLELAAHQNFPDAIRLLSTLPSPAPSR